jgi:uridylate kinase
MDSTAASLCMENNIDIRVFALSEPGNLLRAVRGEDIGTMITNG